MSKSTKLSRLDLIDQKILYELDLDCRQPASKIGRKLRVAKETVNYRIKRLEEKGIIQGYITEVNMAKIGLTTYKVYYQFQYLDEKSEADLIAYLTNHPKVFWVARTNGRWDMLTMIFAKEPMEFYTILEEIINRFHKKILNKAFLVNVEVFVFRKEYLLPEQHEFYPTKMYAGKIVENPLDEFDKRLLKLVAKNARLSAVELAQTLDSSARVVAYRLKDLQEKKIITTFRVLIDLKKLGYSFFKTFIYLHNTTKERRNAFNEYCRQKENIVYISNVAGPWDVELELEVESDEKFNQLMWDLRNNFSDIIRNVESVLVTKDYGLNYKVPFPE
jgi:DNA-binding Lrp family transcriptional regulator